MIVKGETAVPRKPAKECRLKARPMRASSTEEDKMA